MANRYYVCDGKLRRCTEKQWFTMIVKWAMAGSPVAMEGKLLGDVPDVTDWDQAKAKQAVFDFKASD